MEMTGSSLRIALVATALTSALGSIDAHAQRIADAPETGIRVRITTFDSGPKIVGSLKRLTADSVFYSDGGKKSPIQARSLADVAQIETSGGKSAGIGALKGSIAGIVLGGIVGAVLGSNQPERSYGEETRSVCQLFGGGCHSETVRVCQKNCVQAGALPSVLGWAVVGVSVGAVTGAIVGSEKWILIH
jgi:hypothetical protein